MYLQTTTTTSERGLSTDCDDANDKPQLFCVSDLTCLVYCSCLVLKRQEKKWALN